jgi:hypothetical protein
MGTPAEGRGKLGKGGNGRDGGTLGGKQTVVRGEDPALEQEPLLRRWHVQLHQDLALEIHHRHLHVPVPISRMVYKSI